MYSSVWYSVVSSSFSFGEYMADINELPEIRLDSAHLYKEESFTDRRAGTLKRLTPIHADGSADPSRKVLWEGSASLMTPAGALPIHFDLDVETFSEALEKYPEAARAALEKVLHELNEMRREASSSIVVPGQSPGSAANMNSILKGSGRN